MKAPELRELNAVVIILAGAQQDLAKTAALAEDTHPGFFADPDDPGETAAFRA